MSVNSLSTSNPKEQEQKFLNDHETQVLYELRGILNAIESINRTILDAIQLTSSGGRLYEAQQRSNTGLDDFKKLISK
ncbi:unnamed protein product [Rhizophagus irregularis]|nr:hypothetical protein RirG_238000 [Rhizophagus irregularis DAOM 197198w]UZO04150.1 hypothetical protein OCT59_024543 [Rhizophagus irregularis]GBC14364.1 hypothetical protein RIR_jg39145.t1 [Rhizophagus irregularis DAOM 181602=DAOM 197198]CAB4395849.1 unnamed protein product [Rhizophagus irregularis]CAB4442044.1 unnamed protein product [Rhizophagus irregularis]